MNTLVETMPYITGVGLITPLGQSVDQNWNALLAGEFIRDHARVTFDQSGPRIHQMASVAAREAVAHALWTKEVLHDDSTALVIGTSKGPIETWMTCGPAGSETAFGLADVATRLSRELDMGTGPRATLSAACASGLHALIHAVMLLKSGTAKRVLVVAVEASIHPLFIGSFKRLGVLAPEGHGCRPFDQDRKGFLMSEAAAAICLEITPGPGQKPVVAVEQIAIGADATHLTGGDPAGRTLRALLAKVIGAPPVDFVHAHATGTISHDPTELAAIESVVTGPAPAIYSHKGALGHSLGAAGLVAVVLNCLSHRTGLIPSNVRTENPIPSRLNIHTQAAERRIKRSVAVASGFGGAMAAVSLKSVE